MKSTMKIGFVLILLVVVFGAWQAISRPDYSKPWWTGTETQEVCDAHNSYKCYELSVSSNGEGIEKVYFPNGGYITPRDSDCGEKSGGGGVCTFWEENGTEWDVIQ